MKLRGVIDEQAFESALVAEIEQARPAVEEAMAIRFHQITLSNFGIAGPDRPITWAPLSGAYARKVGREIATLVVSGRLKQAVKQEGNEVSISKDDVPYALAHQYGYAPKNLPARPYFPIDRNGNCMPWTYGEVTEAAQNEMDRQVNL